MPKKRSVGPKSSVRKRERDVAHKRATDAARQQQCLLCDRQGCVPAHWPKHRGMGGALSDPWDPSKWVPLCVPCHDWIDGRRGGVSADACEKREADRARLEQLSEEWWESL